MSRIRSLCVYCGSSPGTRPEYADTAMALGRHLAETGIRLVYGGGRVGLMGAVADGCLAAGGEVVGVIPRALEEKELAHLGATEMHVVESMHERKTRMADLADAFLAMPGGIGTLEEIFEVYTWTQLGFHAKPCGFLDVAGYFAPLTAFLDRMVDERFLREEHREFLFVGTGFAELIGRMEEFDPPDIGKWLDRAGQT